jgi:hypothetical protein
MGIYEVTQKQYTTVMGDNPSQFRADEAQGGSLPVERVT